ncbi:MAG TPA: hypothetical protein VGG28_18190 [Kofleriaceae bacterium]
MDKADAIATILPKVEQLLADAERELCDAIAKHALRPKLNGRAKIVRLFQLQAVRFELLVAPNDERLLSTKATWEQMSADEIIAAYTAAL